ncbi:MAG TPA: hypothetical protein VKX96_05475 [Chloroflexota bacterium]|nr:hypothetical protein [Chloroflexota bacterium]
MTENDHAEPMDSEDGGIDIGILTKGKATLGMVLASLLLQETVTVRIYVVDTSERPVINREDVRFALRLAGDRGILCHYDFAGESDLAFSAGKRRLIQALPGRHLCLMDDDVVMPSVALKNLVATAQNQGTYGYISPICKNSPNLDAGPANRPQYSPGSLIYQDELVHRVLLAYYETTVDVLDKRKSDQKVWETAFLTALFEVLNRTCLRQEDTITYHLDYKEDKHWIDEERTVVARSRLVARELVERVRSGTVQQAPVISTSTVVARPAPISRWTRWARRAFRFGA